MTSSSQPFDIEFQSEISNFKSEIVVLLSGGRRHKFHWQTERRPEFPGRLTF